MFWILVFPIMLTFILSTMLEPLYQTENTIQNVTIDIINNSQDEIGVQAFLTFLNELQKEEVITYHLVTDREEAEIKLQDQTTSAIIELTGENLSIAMVILEDSIENRVIESMVKSYIDNEKIVQTLIQIKPELLMEFTFERTNMVEKEEGGIGFAIMDYYGIAMIVMTIFMVSMMGAMENFIEEKKDKTIIRLKIAPQNQFMMFIHTNLSAIPLVFLQIGTLMIANIIILDVTYCDNVKDNMMLFVMLTMVTLALISIGTFIGLLSKKSILGLVNTLIWLMLFLSGTFSKEIAVEGITEYLPPYLIQQAAFDLTLYGNVTNAITVTITAIIIFIGFNILGAAIFSPKRSLL